MRLVAPCCLALLLAGALSAQVGGYVHGGTRGYGLGFGNVVFPGGTAPAGSSATPSFGQRLGATIRGNPYGVAGWHTSSGRQHPFVAPAIVPYPVFVGGYGYGYTPEPVVTVVQAPPAPPSAPPAVIINNYYTPETAKPLMRDYTKSPPEDAPESDGGVTIYRAPAPEKPAPAAARRDQEATLYLIAFKNGTILAALGYWVERDTLHYITQQGTINKASLSLIDRELSERLNRERNVGFDLGKVN